MTELETPWLRFHMAESRYAIPLNAVAEVTTASAPRIIPQVPIEVGGILNIRGEPLPVVDGGVLLAESPTCAHRQVLVLESGQARVGVLVGYVTDLDRGLGFRPIADEDTSDDSLVRWVRDGQNRIGLVDPEALFDRASKLLTGQRQQAGEEECPSAF